MVEYIKAHEQLNLPLLYFQNILELFGGYNVSHLSSASLPICSSLFSLRWDCVRFGISSGENETQPQHYGLGQDFHLLLRECGSFRFFFFFFAEHVLLSPLPVVTELLFFGDLLHVVWLNLTTSSLYTDRYVIQAWPGCLVEVIGSGRVTWAKPKNQSLPRDFFSRVIRKKALFLPAGIVSYKDDVSLERWWSSWTYMERAWE